MFHYEDGLMLTRPRLAVDFRRRQPRCFVSHAHADHMARHELALATPATAALYRHRLGIPMGHTRQRVREMAFGEPIEFGGATLTAVPAGHCLGSAMLLAEVGGERLLYTGDFKLGDALTARRADPPRADILVMESTFGRPEYRLPPRGEVVGELVELVQSTIAAGKTPVIHAYAMGKSQEVTKILTEAGTPVLQHPTIYAISRVYEECGMSLASPGADYGEYTGRALGGHAVVTLPKSMKGFRLGGLGETVSIAVTGWAMNPSTRYRLRVDHALPLSDHADYKQLLELPRLVEPRVVYCTHGPAGFVDLLAAEGWDARPLAPEKQGRLF